MNWAEIKKTTWFKCFVNKYVLISSLFVFWMLFFDDASLTQHITIDNEIEELKEDRDFYKDKLNEVKAELKKVKEDPESIEKIARERFYMKKDNEDIFILVDDSKEE